MKRGNRRGTNKIKPRTLSLRLTPQFGGSDEAETLLVGWDLVDRFQLDRLIVTIMPERGATHGGAS